MSLSSHLFYDSFIVAKRKAQAMSPSTSVGSIKFICTSLSSSRTENDLEVMCLLEELLKHVQQVPNHDISDVCIVTATLSQVLSF